ncbi:MAG: hypothetical protein ABI045_04030 [Flavobacteriales bacterium]
MSTDTLAKLEQLEKIVHLAHKYKIMLIPYNPYNFILNLQSLSIFQIKGGVK